MTFPSIRWWHVDYSWDHLSHLKKVRRELSVHMHTRVQACVCACISCFPCVSIYTQPQCLEWRATVDACIPQPSFTSLRLPEDDTEGEDFLPLHLLPKNPKRWSLHTAHSFPCYVFICLTQNKASPKAPFWHTHQVVLGARSLWKLTCILLILWFNREQQ